MSFFGIVSLIKIENVWSNKIDLNEDAPEKDRLTEHAVKIVHYSDCQQLTLWLPSPGHLYDQIAMSDAIGQVEIWQKDVAEILSGSIQIILDTLDYSPGEYSIVISRKDGLQHIIHIKKYEEGSMPSVKQMVQESSAEFESSPNVYKDGFGNVINYDNGINSNKMSAKYKRKVSYEGSGKSHTIIYKDNDKAAKFYSEFGTGNCIFYIHIPTLENWESETGFSVEEREEILQFIAETVLRDQTTSSGAYFEIEENWINFYN